MTDSMAQPVAASNPLKRVLAIRDFLLLWMGQSTSLLGDQFHFIAMSWLVLKMTGDPLALGAVLAVGGLPRAVFTLVGGAVTDRVSPRRVMLVSDLIRFFISALLAAQVLTGTLQIWMIYVYSFMAGIVSGAFEPASMSMTPHLVPADDLQAGNSVMQGSVGLIGFVGPAMAGVLVAAARDVRTGVASAMAFDAFTFVVSVVTLWLMKTGGDQADARQTQPPSVFESICEGIRFMFRDPALRAMFILIAVANFAFGGPIVVGVPFLASSRFAEGAAAFGLIIAGYAGGNVLGIILCGALPKGSPRLLKVFLVIMFAAFGTGLGALAWIHATGVAVADMFVLGVLNGYLSILLMTGLQRNTPKEMLGRLMSMVLLANLGLSPLSQAIAGAMLHWNIYVLFLAAGAMLLTCALYLTLPRVNSLLTTRFLSESSESL
ncbi:MAG TPA: MFS transporter [Anaerolineales bacterium]|nr:MFS transporter [Anaerolineales bacterium]